MYKYKHDLLPGMFDNFFSRNQDQHTYGTRNAAKLRTNLSGTQTGSKFIKFTGVGFWNLLENNIITDIKIGPFKRLLKGYIIN